jgi:hypothetical protein
MPRIIIPLCEKHLLMGISCILGLQNLNVRSFFDEPGFDIHHSMFGIHH